MIKRLIDFVVSTSVLLLLLPLLLGIAVLVRVNLGSPVLFSQIRPGLNGKPFRMYKFRTMLSAVGEQGIPLPDNQRITPFGQFLRSSSLDELPELWNVMFGDMSLVGPRPLLIEYLPLYTSEQARRHEVKPGLTGWAQVNGRNALTWDQKFAHDIWYVDNRSLSLDAQVLCMTFAKVLRREGISASDDATMPKFRGSKNSQL